MAVKESRVRNRHKPHTGVRDPRDFKNFLGIEPAMFKELLLLLDRVGPRIEKEDTYWRPALDPGLKLAVTVRFLAAGDS